MATNYIERLIHSGFWITTTLVFIMAALLYRSIDKFVESGQQVEHTHQVLENLAIVSAEYSRAESAHRGYLISSNTAYATEYRLALDKVSESLNSLKTLSKGNPAQQLRLNRLEEILTIRLTILDQLMTLHETEGSDTARNQIIAKVREQHARPDFFQLLAQMAQKERALLKTRQGDELRHSKSTLLILIIVLLIGGLALVPAYIGTIKETRARRRAEVLEKESNDFLRLTLDSVPGMFFYVDQDGRYRFHNKAFAQLMELKDKMVVGAKVSEVLDESLYLTVEPKHREVMQGQAVNYELHHITGDGRPIDLDVRYVPHFNESDQVQGFFGMLIDITEREREKTSLRETNAFQKAILHFTDFAMIAIDTSGVIKSFNVGAEKMLGYSADEIVGKTSPVLFHVEGEIKTRAEILSRELGTVIAPNMDVFIAKSRQGGVDEGEWTYVRKDGGHVPVFLSVRALYADTDEIIGYVGIADDVTARKEAEARFDRFFRLSPDLLCIAGTDGYFKQINPVFSQTLGWTQEELLANPISEFVHPDDREDSGNQASDLATGQPVVQYENRYCCKDGSWRWLAWRSVLQSDGLIFATARDVTWQRETNQQLEHAKAEAEAALRAKSAFLATMSHEIRTPMNGVIGMVDILTHTSLSEHQTEMLKTIQDSASTLLKIIDDILDFSKIEAGKLTIERVSLSISDLVEGLCSSLVPVATQKNVDLWLFISPDIPERVLSDDVRLRQVLYNLIGNAIKFSGGRPEQRGRVSVRVDVENTAPLRLIFGISDNGIGMTAETIANIFTPFTQAEISTTRRFGGTGLGLAISTRLVDLMHGEITVESIPGEGTTFTVGLPFTAAEEQPPRDLPDLTGIDCVLEQSPELDVGSLRIYLEHAGARVRHVVHAAAAIPGKSFPAPVVMIRNAGRRPSSNSKLGAPLVSTSGIRGLLITRLESAHPEARPGDTVALDADSLRRKTFLNAVAVAAGRSLSERFENTTLQIAHAKKSLHGVVPANTANRLILVAEDDAINQDVILQQLALLGYAVELASNGEAALRMWRIKRYALLLTDIHMPEMDGYMLTEAIRKDEVEGRHMPIVALTANALQGEARRALDAGMDAYLTKPVQLHLLRDALEEWLPYPDDLPLPAMRSHESDHDFSAAVDISALVGLIGDDPHTLRRFLLAFLTSVLPQSGDLQAAFAAGHISRVGAIAHRLKSASASIGATPLSALCGEMESAGSRGDRESIAQQLPRFEAALAAVKAAIDRLLNNS